MMEEQKEEKHEIMDETTSSLPKDYLERVYAGVLGKLIGVYMGRPFEGWTHQRILAELGHIRYYVNEKLKLPIVVTDDDISGTFTFVRALEEHYTRCRDPIQHQESHDENEDRMEITETLETTEASETSGTPSIPNITPPSTPGITQEKIISAEQVGKTWLNNVIKDHTVFWWGGNGISTEHTAFLNLRKGIKAPHSGSIQTNGRTIAQQIGAQIFIDGFAMTAPGNPALAAQLAGAAGSVSHDGEAVYAAQLWAAMEAEAFASKDVNHLLNTGLSFVPSDSLIAALVRDVRAWCEDDDDWIYTRQRIEKKYGYDKFPGFCHVVPNHGIMIMSLIYGGHDFAEAMHIVNTCGWDTDCNSGNVGCLVAIMHGLEALDSSKNNKGKNLDWRGPLDDRAWISSADGGYSMNNATNIAYSIANMGRKLVGEEALASPKEGAQFHFSLPGSLQGFQIMKENTYCGILGIKQGTIDNKRTGLEIRLPRNDDMSYVMTATFITPEITPMCLYELVASPLIYPGQVISASIYTKNCPSSVCLVVKAYTHKDELKTLSSAPVYPELNSPNVLKWRVPVNIRCQPIQAVGIAISSKRNLSTNESEEEGIWLEYLRWDGTPALVLEPGNYRDGPRTFYKRSFVNGADVFSLSSGTFAVAQDQGEGIVSYGTRDWTNYRAIFRDFVVNIGGPAGVAARVRGLNRYYALLFYKGTANISGSKKRIALVKALDYERIELASVEFDWQYDIPYTVTLKVSGDLLYARVGKTELSARDAQYPGGGIGMVVTDGSILVGSIKIGPLI